MYGINDFELTQFLIAEKQLADLKHQHAIELQQAYDDIHPTRTTIDYNLGKIYSESINPAEYAIYLIELRQKHERIEKWWILRADAYRQALRQLSEEERKNLSSYQFEKQHAAKEKLRKALKEVVSKQRELQFNVNLLEELEELEEYDRQIDAMSEEELLKDYEDPLDDLEEE